jgi:IclR family transcriptional regulator, acetate operon repressor
VTRSDGEPTLITSVQRALRLLEEVSRYPAGTSAKSLARRTGIALPTAYHLLRTLVHEGYLVKLDDGGFVVGDQVADVYSSSRDQVTRSRVRSVMAGLREKVSAATYLARYDEGEIDVFEIVDNVRTPRVDMWADFRETAHATALGKCLLSALSEQERADHFNRYPPTGLTPRTVTRVQDLVQRRGLPGTANLVLDSQEYALGAACLAAPVQGADQPLALAISFPARKLSEAPAYAKPLSSAASEVARTFALAAA